MNQILLQVLAQDPMKTPGICLSFRWLVPLFPHLETVSGWFVFPLLGTWLGCLFLDINDLCDQLFSFTGLLYFSTIVSMIPKPNTSSKLWINTNLFTIVCYAVYFAELAIVAHLCLDLEYSVSWLFSLSFSTISIFMFYGILHIFGFSTPAYLKTIATICLVTDVGSILALGIISPFWSHYVASGASIFFFIYFLYPYRRPLISFGLPITLLQRDTNLSILRCLFWGALTVWADYIALTPFYILEMILTCESHNKHDSVLNYCRNWYTTHKFKLWENMGNFTLRLLYYPKIMGKFCTQKKALSGDYFNSGGRPVLFMKSRSFLYSRKL
ncbi:MAG: hypothetical protein FJX03_06405 [Alphaproteobacteria bacterium]|nr:hypothetical protein [Alphaproteobacteria bacterium]